MAGLSDHYKVTVHVHQETYPNSSDQGALLCSQSGDKDDGVWVPKSQIHSVEKTGKPGIWKIIIPEWLCAEKEFE